MINATVSLLLVTWQITTQFYASSGYIEFFNKTALGCFKDDCKPLPSNPFIKINRFDRVHLVLLLELFSECL